MCLDRWQTAEMKGQPAVIWEGENSNTRTLTYKELLLEVDLCALGLRQQGFEKGDAIGIHLPMIPETIIALLAIGRIGAIAVPVFSGYGVSAIEARLNAVNAKALFTCNEFARRGKPFDSFTIGNEATSNCPSVRKVYIVQSNVPIDTRPYCDVYERIVDFDELVHEGGWFAAEEAVATTTSAEDPLIILYTSGTTGKPKGIVHTHASFPIKAAQDMAFGTDVGKGTRISWYTDPPITRRPTACGNFVPSTRSRCLAFRPH
jgi:acetyl-CoA synthetase